MANENKDKTTSALVTGKHVANNPNLQKVLQNVVDGYKPHRIGKSNRQIRIDHTAMIENDKPIYGYKTVHNESTNTDEQIPRLLYRAGWYLSPEENAIKEGILADEANKKLNETIWKQMEQAGMTVEKSPAEVGDAKVVAN